MLQIETTAGSWGRVYVSNRWWQQLLSASSSVSFEVMRNLWNKCSLSCNGETHLHTSWKYDCTNLYFIFLRRLNKPLDIFSLIQWHCCRHLNFKFSFCKQSIFCANGNPLSLLQWSCKKLFSRRSFDVQVLRENVYMAHEAETILCVTY